MVLSIPVQKLFFLVLLGKVASSFAGWWYGDPWILGFTVPIGLMLVYIALGSMRSKRDVSNEKFADSCYYLGFIFTITSIIFCLLDLPQIGTQIQNIAVRFGAAMVSTVLGLAVRVYLVSFKRDAADAFQDAESSLLEASLRFNDNLARSIERLKGFQDSVDDEAKSTVERVKLQVESLSKNHADKLTEFFEALTKRNETAFTTALDEVKEASLRLSASVDGYSEGMKENLKSIEEKVSGFADAVTRRLETTTFPDDYFAKNLAGPIQQISLGAKSLSDEIGDVAGQVKQSNIILGTALKSLRTKATSTESALDTVLGLTEQQQQILSSAQGQMALLQQLASALQKAEEGINSSLAEARSSREATEQVTRTVREVLEARRDDGESLRAALATLGLQLKAVTEATRALETRMVSAPGQSGPNNAGVAPATPQVPSAGDGRRTNTEAGSTNHGNNRPSGGFLGVLTRPFTQSPKVSDWQREPALERSPGVPSGSLEGVLPTHLSSQDSGQQRIAGQIVEAGSDAGLTSQPPNPSR